MTWVSGRYSHFANFENNRMQWEYNIASTQQLFRKVTGNKLSSSPEEAFPPLFGQACKFEAIIN